MQYPTMMVHSELLSTYYHGRNIAMSNSFPFVDTETSLKSKKKMALEINKNCIVLSELCAEMLKNGGKLDFVPYGDELVPAWVIVEAIFSDIKSFWFNHGMTLSEMGVDPFANEFQYKTIAASLDLTLKATPDNAALNPVFITGITWESWVGLDGYDPNACPLVKRVLYGNGLLDSDQI